MYYINNHTQRKMMAPGGWDI